MYFILPLELSAYRQCTLECKIKWLPWQKIVQSQLINQSKLFDILFPCKYGIKQSEIYDYYMLSVKLFTDYFRLLLWMVPTWFNGYHSLQRGNAASVRIIYAIFTFGKQKEVSLIIIWPTNNNFIGKQKIKQLFFFHKNHDQFQYKYGHQNIDMATKIIVIKFGT